ncbi:MAG: S49 family peptidase [bacterium]
MSQFLECFKNFCKVYYSRVFSALALIIIFVLLNAFSYAMYDSYGSKLKSLFSGRMSADSSGSSSGSSDYSSSDSTTSSWDDSQCNVVGINMHGYLDTYALSGDNSTASADTVLSYIRQANDKENIKAILLEVDSGGGSSVAGEEIANALKNSPKETVAVIRQQGASAAYWASTGAKYIFASKNSDVGSIGVTASYLSDVEKNKKAGLTYVDLFVGKYKEMGNPDRVLTQEEKDLYMRDLNIILDNFVQAVSTNRHLPLTKVRSLADGSSMLGVQAQKAGLIDGIGDVTDAEKYLTNKLGEKAEICWN